MAPRLQSLKQHRSPLLATSDLLNWAIGVDDGIVLCKDGALIGGWHFRGPDLANATPQYQEQVSGIINTALLSLGSDYAIHVDAGRTPSRDYPHASLSAFPDPISRLIDEERRQQFERAGAHYETIQTIILTYLPPRVNESKVLALIYDDQSPATQNATNNSTAKQNPDNQNPAADPQTTPDQSSSIPSPAKPRSSQHSPAKPVSSKPSPSKQSPAEAALRHFKAKLMELEDQLSSVLELQRMQGITFEDEQGRPRSSDELLSHLRWTMTGEVAPLNRPGLPLFLDGVLGADELWTGTTPRHGDYYIQCIAIDGFPLDTQAGILMGLAQMPFAYRWCTRFIFQDQEAAATALRGYRRRWAQKVRGIYDQLLNREPTSGSIIDGDAQAMVTETDRALAQSSSGLVGYGYYTSVLVLYDRDRQQLEEASRFAKRRIIQHGFAARIETVNTLEAWLGSLPGHIVQNIRRPMLHTLHLANLLPISSVWTGEPYAPCPLYPRLSPPLLHAATEGSTPYRLNLHVDDVGHSLMFGPTGAGKSTALALIAAQFRRYPDAAVYVFDKGNSLECLTRAVGGNHYTITDAPSTDSPTSDSPTSDSFTNDSPTKNPAPSFAPLSRSADLGWQVEWVETLMRLQGHVPTASQRNELSRALKSLATTSHPTLTGLQIELQDLRLREVLQPYTLNGIYGKLLDDQEDQMQLGSWTTWEIGELMQREDRIRIPVLLYLFRCVEVAAQGQPSLMILDEAWVMLGNAVFKDKIREWLKTLRKANVAVLLATQSLSDAADSGIMDTLSESCATKIYLANPDADQGDNPKLYAALGLQPPEIQTIKHMTPKREYYIRSSAGSRRINLSLGKTALMFTGISTKDDLARVRDLQQRHGDSWTTHWMAERNASHAN